MLHKSGCDDTQRFLETLPCAVALLSRDGAFGILNGSAKRLVKFSAKDLINRSSFWVEHIHADDQNSYLKFRKKLVKRETPDFCDYRFFPKDATEPIWIREVSALVNNPAIPWDIASGYTEISDLKLVHSGTNKPSSVQKIILPLIHELQNRLQVMSMALELGKIGLTEEWDFNRLIELVGSMKHSIQEMHNCFRASEEEAAFLSGPSAKRD